MLVYMQTPLNPPTNFPTNEPIGEGGGQADLVDDAVSKNVGQEPPWLHRLWRSVSPLDHPVAWLAIGGAALILTAALSSTTASWADASIPQRVGGMVVIHALICWMAEHFRRSVPKSAQAIAHLGATLFVPTGISLTAAGGGSWRSCILMGGSIGIVALELQGRRWSSRWMKPLQVGAAVLGLAGSAAILHLPVGILVGVAAVATMAVRTRHIEACGLSVIAALSPVLALLARWKFGPGTIAELGATGRPLGWSAPVVGLLACSVLLVLSRSHLRWQPWLVAAAFASATSGALVGLGNVHLSPLLTACLAPTILILTELVVSFQLLKKVLPADSRSYQGFLTAVDAFEVLVLLLLLSERLGFRTSSMPVIPLVLAAVGFSFGTIRTRAFLPRIFPAGAAVVCAVGALASVTSSGWPLVWTLFGALCLWAWLGGNRQLQVLASVIGPVILSLQLRDFGVEQPTVAVVLVVLAIAALGLSASFRRGLTPLDTAAVAALLVASFAPERTLAQSVAFTGAGLVAFALGTMHRHRAMQTFGAIWSLSGLAWVLSLASVARITEFDVMAVLLLAGAALIERLARRDMDLPGTEFVFPSLSGAAYLLTTSVTTGSGTRIGVALLLGVISVGLGVVKRLPALAVAGGITIIGSLLLATWDQLADLPTWAWLLLGGVSLLGLAIVVERRRSISEATSGEG